MQANELKEVLKKSKKCMVYAGIFSVFVNLLMLTPPLYMLQLYGRVVTSRSLDTLIFLTLIVFALFAFMGLFEILRSRVLVIFANQMDINLSSRIYDAIFKMAAKNPGRATSQAMGDLNTLKQYLSTNGVFAFLDAPWLPFYIFILFLFHPYYGYFSIFAAIILLILAILNENTTKDGLKKSNDSYKSSIKFIDTNLRNSEVIYAMGMNKNLRKIWKDRHDNFLNAHSDTSIRAGVYTNLSKTFRIASQSAMLGIGAYLVVKMEISPGAMIAGSIIMGRALAPLDILISSWKSYRGARESYLRLSQFLQSFPEKDETLKLPDPKGVIQLEGVSLVPPYSKIPSLHNINLKLNSGEMCAIIGPSAAGKSSLARAILGVWPIANGVVRIDGADINQYDNDHLGQFVGYLPQDVELFDGSIAENIARFGELDSEAIVKAAKMANVHDMILKLPDGYDTRIGFRGTNLSGGQRQRVALARALYKDPRIIVLDEPNASLDDEGERALFFTLMNLKTKATIIIITHKLNVLNAVDKIAVLSGGHLVHFGEKNQVLMQLNAYSKASLDAKAAKDVSTNESKEH